MGQTNLHDNSSINTRLPGRRYFLHYSTRATVPGINQPLSVVSLRKREFICIAVQPLVVKTKGICRHYRFLPANMKIQSAVFEVSSPTLELCPRLALPEFAFIGRSNVGKSSLINMLTGKMNLAKVSDLPGKTRLMNFFTINRNWRLVDLPGYGYAHVAKAERADFNEAVADYLRGRENLAGVFVLVDSRHEPHAIDLDFISWLAENEIHFAVVFTKIDKLSASQVQSSMTRFKQTALTDLAPVPTIFASSAKTKLGRNDILSHVAEMLKSHQYPI